MSELYVAQTGQRELSGERLHLAAEVGGRRRELGLLESAPEVDHLDARHGHHRLGQLESCGRRPRGAGVTITAAGCRQYGHLLPWAWPVPGARLFGQGG